MRGSKAKKLRRERVAKGLPAFAEPVHNFTDLDDNHADRRLKKNRIQWEHQLRQTDPRKQLENRYKWGTVLLYLLSPPVMRPYLEKYVGDPTQEERQAAYEAKMEKFNEDLEARIEADSLSDIERWDREREEAMS